MKKNKTQSWYVNGKLHRLDGPAYITASGWKAWYVNDKNITDEVTEWLQLMNITCPFTDEEKVLFAVRFA